ncbi:MAG: hydrogenase maturation protease [Nostocaceae cyanobacterium]|nr:hydrogenase maturation protease [Nostocaceae cyanobacterium]
MSDINCLVIGYGNTLRSDDGVGQIVATKVEEWGLGNITSLAVHQLTPELAELLARVQMVIFVDVYIADGGENQGLQVYRLEVDGNSQMGHTANPRSLLGLTEKVYRVVPESWWIVIPGVNFEFGEQLSDVAESGVSVALSEIYKLVNSSSDFKM